MRAKICGVTQLNDALTAANEGAWALGFNFYPHSLRYIEKKQAKEIIGKLPKTVLKVGVFVGDSDQEISETMEYLALDLAQIYHLSNAPDALKKKMILSLKPKELSDLPSKEILKQYAYILIDSPQDLEGCYGGTGKLAIWDIACFCTEHRLILSGGLKVGNVENAMTKVQPFAVDVASGVESSPGIKNSLLVKQFLKKVHNYE